LRQAHAAQNVWSLGELDIVIANDLDAIAPAGVAEIEKRTADRLDPCRLEGGARRLLVIDNQADECSWRGSPGRCCDAKGAPLSLPVCRDVQAGEGRPRQLALASAALLLVAGLTLIIVLVILLIFPRVSELTSGLPSIVGSRQISLAR
jgi:hypothetical protein